MTTTVDISPALLEQAEAQSWADFEAAASDAAKAALGARELRIGGGVALAVTNDPEDYWSVTTGLGFAEPVTGALMRRIVEFYREQDVSGARIAIAPDVLPPDWSDICAELNITSSGAARVKLASDLGTVADRSRSAARLDTGLRVAEVTADRAREWAEVMRRGFGHQPGPMVEMGVGVVGRPGWRAFAVFEGDAIVGTGCLHIYGAAGHLFAGETLPHARRRGAQSALIAARAAAAGEAGCTWLVGEAVAEKPGEHNPSLHNQLRAGLTARYRRPMWRWQEPAPPGVTVQGPP
jgi:hypothetical protein